MRRLPPALVRAALAVAIALPLAVAATSPLLAWRGPVYIAGCFAGVIGLALLLVQPLLAAGALPGAEGRRGRRLHAWVGAGLIAAVVLHVGALWLTSPPDLIDALLLRSPTPFSVWGVAAMWAVFATGLLAAFRRRLTRRLGPGLWRRGHLLLGALIAAGVILHAMLIDGIMEGWTKAGLCALVAAAAARAILAGRRRRPAAGRGR